MVSKAPIRKQFVLALLLAKYIFSARSVHRVAAAAAAAWTPNILPLPSRVDLDDVSISYQETLVSRLFSSVPKRKYSIDHVTLSISGKCSRSTGETVNADPEHDIELPTILVGRSACGKSSLLRLISGQDIATTGSVCVNGVCLAHERTRQSTVAPIIIDRRISVDDSRTVMDQILLSASDEQKQSSSENGKHDIDSVKSLASDFATVLGLTSKQLLQKPSELNPSGQFLFSMAVGCMQSLFATTLISPDVQEGGVNGVRYPILLLDELFDFEHPDVPRKCCSGISRLVEMGAVVVIATHRPHHWEALEQRRVIALSSGRILSQERLSKGQSTTITYK